MLIMTPFGSVGKNPPANAGCKFDPWVGKNECLGEGNGEPLQYSCLEKFHGQRSLAGYSPWGYKKSNTTKHAHMHAVTYGLFRIFLLSQINTLFCSDEHWIMPSYKKKQTLEKKE